MSRTSSLDTGAVAMAVGAFLAAGVLTWAGLSMLSRPANLRPRLAAVEHQAEHAERIARTPAASGSYPGGAVCQNEASGLASLKGTIDRAAAQSGLRGADFTAAPPAGSEAGDRLQPVKVSLQAIGPYPALNSLLQTLSTSTPSVFVDTLDLRTADGVVTLKLSGRFYCSLAHP